MTGHTIDGRSCAGIKHLDKQRKAQTIYWIYASRVNQENVAWPGIESLSNDADTSKHTAGAARKWLIEHKALEPVPDYVRPDWRELPAQERARKLNFDRAEYFRPTGFIEWEGERYPISIFNSHVPRPTSHVREQAKNEDVRDGATPDVPRPQLSEEQGHQTPETDLSRPTSHISKFPVILDANLFLNTELKVPKNLLETVVSNGAPLSDSQENDARLAAQPLSEEITPTDESSPQIVVESQHNPVEAKIAQTDTPSEKPQDVPAAVAPDPNPVAPPPSPPDEKPPQTAYMAALADAFGYDLKTMTKTLRGNFGKVAAELRESCFPTDHIGGLYRFVERMAKDGNWSSWTVNVLTTKAEEYRKKYLPAVRYEFVPAQPVPESTEPKVYATDEQIADVLEHFARVAGGEWV